MLRCTVQINHCVNIPNCKGLQAGTVWKYPILPQTTDLPNSVLGTELCNLMFSQGRGDFTLINMETMNGKQIILHTW